MLNENGSRLFITVPVEDRGNHLVKLVAGCDNAMKSFCQPVFYKVGNNIISNQSSSEVDPRRTHQHSQLDFNMFYHCLLLFLSRTQNFMYLLRLCP